MTSFANLTANLNLNIHNFASNMRRASSLANQFSANLRGQINGGIVEPARNSKFEFKDVARIVQGIIISKVFYGGLNAIRRATDAVWEFSQELEYAKMAYSNLFGDTALADEFINVLKDFAATTPFSFQESEAAAKRLLAYGIQYKNVMYVMHGVLAASSMQGNPQVIESVSRALGQIYTKGRLMNEEMRQLAEAGIPAYEILQEKLGLTQKQLQKLGKEDIPASKAINALVDGMNERFGGVVAASSKTLKGIISNIKDNALMLVSGAFEPLVTYIKSGLSVLEKFLFNMREIFELKGLGGVFEAIFPPELHSTLRLLVANLSNLFQAVVRLASALGNLLRPALIPVLDALITVFNAFAPIITIVLNALSVMVSWITQNATAMKILTTTLATAALMWAVFKAKALVTVIVASVISLISKALAGLATMLTFVAAHPFWSLLIALTGLVVGLSGGFGKLSDAISGVFKKITAINGIDPDKVLLPSQKERANDLNKFNKALDSTKDSMDDLADSTGKATKAAKGLLSFDEVFKLNQPDEGTNNGIYTDTDLSGLGASSFIPEVPSFEGFADNFVTDMVKALKDKFLAAGIGSILGAILGGILGGPLGVKIGAITGAIAGWFWNDLADALGLTDVGKVALPIATMLGSIIGALIGGPMGAVIGAGIGALVGWLIDAITRGFENGDWSQVGYPLGIGLGAGLGFLVGGPAGAAIGAAIGALVSWISDLIVTGVTTGAWDFSKLGLGIGTGIGAAIGMVVGGPAGAAIGAAIGALVGWLVGLIVDNWSVISQWFVNIGTAIGNWCIQTWTDISNWVVNTVTAIDSWASNVLNTISAWATNTATAITNWSVNTWNSFTTWVSNTCGTFTTWVTNTAIAITNWATNTWKSITTWVSNTWNAFTNWITNTSTAIINWSVNTWKTLTNWCSNTWNSFTNWMSNLWNSFANWLSNLGSAISNWFGNLQQTAEKGLSNIWNSITNWISNLWSNIWKQLTDIGSRIRNWWDNLWSGKSANVSVNASGTGSWSGHASGGVFNREHVARFAEGNKAEAIIPLENEGAMQPFVDAVANGITASLMPIVANISGNQGQLQPLYVGTLIADERSLKELNRKMQVIQLQENKRRG